MKAANSSSSPCRMSLHYIRCPMEPPLLKIAVGPYQWELSLTHLVGTVLDPSVTLVYFCNSAKLAKDSQQMFHGAMKLLSYLLYWQIHLENPLLAPS